MNNFEWSEGEVRRALQLPLPDQGEGGLVFSHVSTDTRSIQQGDLFVALAGERFDAHNFLEQAAAAGAVGAVVSRMPHDAPVSLTYFLVDDTLRALGALGRYRRERHSARVVGVAGSNGKTTTKDLIRAVLATRHRVHSTQGNLNNQIGVPLTLLSAPEDAEVLVVEMGTNEPGEIEILTAIVQPDAGVITSIGEEHLEKLESVAGVLEEELALLAGLGPEAVAVVAEEPAELPERARARLGGRVRVAGFGEGADLRPDGGAAGIRFEPDGSTRWSWRGIEVHLPLPGRWNVRNALIALGIAEAWGIPAEEAVRGIGQVGQPKMRGEWKRIGGVRVLADCYNSNPPSARAALELLAELPAPGPKVAVLGTMRELGASGEALHREVAERAAERVGEGLDLLVATGDFVPAFEPLAARLGDRLVACEDPVEAYAAVAGRLRGDETILLKGSRGVALERWLPLLEKDFANDE